MKKSKLTLTVFGLCFLSTTYIVNNLGEASNFRKLASEQSSVVKDLLSGISTIRISIESAPNQLLKAKEQLEDQIKIAKDESEKKEREKRELDLEISVLNEEIALIQQDNNVQSEKSNSLAKLVDEKSLKIVELNESIAELVDVQKKHEELKLEFEKLASENKKLKDDQNDQILCLIKKQESLEEQIKKLTEDKEKVVKIVEDKDKNQDDSDDLEENENDEDKIKVTKRKGKKKGNKDLKEDDYRTVYTKYFERMLEQQKLQQEKMEEERMMQLIAQMQERSILSQMHSYGVPKTIYNHSSNNEMGMLNYIYEMRDRSSKISRGASPSYLDANSYLGLNSGISFHDQYIRNIPTYFNDRQSYQPQQFNFDSKGYNFTAPSITNSTLAQSSIPTQTGNLSNDFISVF